MTALVLAAVLGAKAHNPWVTLFNGKDLTGWSPKITGYPFGENFGNTFRVKDKKIVVSYDGYGGEFKGRFGHLFYRTPYSNYIFKCEYRFTSEQVADGPGWAWRNSGIMLHCQDPKTMRLDQDFPVSAEFQLLGGPEKGERSTGNLCTPGTNVMMGDKLITQHCTNSTSPTFAGDQWVSAEAEVHGAGLVIHRINGKEVIRYSAIQYDPKDRDGKTLLGSGALEIDHGWISLQSESHPCEFRNIQIQVLPK